MSKIHFLLCCILMSGCGPSKDSYVKTVKSGIKIIPHVDQITALFTNAPIDHLITEFGFDIKKPVVWNTIVYFDGRYVLTYQVDVRVDYKDDTVVGITSKPKFYLWEVTDVFDKTTDHVGAKYSRGGGEFGETEWNKVFAAKGDFSVIGIAINTNSPVPGFDEYVRQWRADRIHVE